MVVLLRALRTTHALLLFAALGATARLVAQVAPDQHWQTLKTVHFRVHFSTGLEPIARRAAGSAERSYSRLARELHEPRGPIDLVVADNLDISNGTTTSFPTNRITIWARPTVDASTLKFIDDWIDLVVSHELAHVFHLDRTRGWWRAAQYIFGRNPFLFPALYEPSWLVEGIAVHYETALTGAGRDAGNDFALVARAQSLDHLTPALNALSAATLSYPLGNTAYVYGSLLVEQMANAHGDSSLRRFIETSSARTIPFLLNTNAKDAFGETFSAAYRHLNDSIAANALRVSQHPNARLRPLTASGWLAENIRWTDNAHLIYGANDGRDVSGLYEVDTKTAKSTRLGRRNTIDVSSPSSPTSRIFAQQEFTDPYTIVNDLYEERDGETTRLTNGSRLMQPDARVRPAAPGNTQRDIVAIQIEPASSRLVRIRFDNGTPDIKPLTTSTPDTVWSTPRWSHDGTRIAATRWTHGGITEIAILDTTGRVLRTLGRSRAVNGTPSWSHDDSAILFTSDRTGSYAVYRATVATGRLERIAESATGLLEAEESPDGSQLATVEYRGNGNHLALVSATGNPQPADTPPALPPSRNEPIATSDAPRSSYNPLPSLLPRYWLPAIEYTDRNRPMYGLITSGRDVIGRHSFQLQATYEPAHAEPSATFTYQYAGLGNPVVGASAIEEWDHLSVRLKDNSIATISRRKRFASLSLTALRPRVRNNAFASVGAQMEWRDFRTDPTDLLARIDSSLTREYTYPTFFVSAGWSNVRFPALAVSYEDGLQLSASAAQRFRNDNPSATRSNSVVATGSAYKSLNLAGFAHHVIALRAAAAWEDEKATAEFKAGGASGSILSIAPGVTLGDGRRTFPVRGFPSSAQTGIQALGGSVEYRAPIALPASGLGMLPLFFQRVSASVFGDAATAWCPTGAPVSILCPANGYPQAWMASTGAEISLDAAYEYDVPYRFRLGAATPIAGRSYFGKSSIVAYLGIGIAF